jgi:AcrR family transcriptional regulator
MKKQKTINESKMTQIASDSTSVSQTRRERNKVARLQRIIDGARHVFHAKGYYGASIEDLAEAADIGTATLYSYARDKRDLLMMVVNADLDALTDTSFATLPRNGSLADQLVHVFRDRFTYWASDIELARVVVHQTLDSGHESQTARYHARRQQMDQLIAKLVDDQIASGAIAKAIDSKLMARLLFDLCLGEQVRWLYLPSPNVDTGMADLQSVLQLALQNICKRTT